LKLLLNEFPPLIEPELAFAFLLTFIDISSLFIKIYLKILTNANFSDREFGIGKINNILSSAFLINSNSSKLKFLYND
jgi:hypothetical protein